MHYIHYKVSEREGGGERERVRGTERRRWGGGG